MPARPLARVQFAVYAYGLIHNCAHYQVQNQFRFRPPCKKSRGCKHCAPPSPFPSSLLLLCRLQNLREESDLDTSPGSPSCPSLLLLFCVARVGEDISGEIQTCVFMKNGSLFFLFSNKSHLLTMRNPSIDTAGEKIVSTCRSTNF